MHKVIGIDFGTRKRKDVEPDRSEEVTPHDEASEITRNTIRTIDFLMDETGDIGMDRNQKLLALPTSHASLASAQQQIKDCNTEELMDWLEKSSEHDWVARPARFKAIYLELQKRLMFRYPLPNGYHR